MATANDIILGALRFINVYAPGESLDSADADDALQTLNDLLESLSTDEAACFATEEDILTFTPGQYIYTVGNHTSPTTFAGTVTNGSPTMTGVIVPSDLIARADLIGSGIPAGTTVVSFNAGLGTITMSANATASPGAQQITYTIPGNFKIPRPLRVRDSFTRITTQSTGLDYSIDVISEQRYIEIGYKGISAPWPICMWYNPTYPLGTLYFYQNPSTAGELHLFSDSLLEYFSDLTEEVVMPQGYVRMLKRALARELAPEYAGSWTLDKEKLYKEAFDTVKALNKNPVPVAKYDSALQPRQRTDAGWILYGGFR